MKKKTKKKKENLARPRFNDDVTVLANGTSLLRIGLGCSCICVRIEVMFFVRHIHASLSFFSAQRIKTTQNEEEEVKKESHYYSPGSVVPCFYANPQITLT